MPDNNDVDDVLGDDIVGPYYLYGIDDEDGYVREFDIFHGPGYWLALAQQANIDVQGTPELDSSRYDLSDYWNIVGASLPTPTQRDDAFFTDGVEYNGFVDAVNAGWIAPVLYGYNNQTGTYFFSNQFVPWNGYWLQVLQEDITLVVYPPHLKVSC